MTMAATTTAAATAASAAAARHPSSSDLSSAVDRGTYSFSSLYHRVQNPAWAEYYVDYEKLDAALSALEAALRSERRARRRRGGRGRRGSPERRGSSRRRVGRSPPRLGHRRYRSSQGLAEPPPPSAELAPPSSAPATAAAAAWSPSSAPAAARSDRDAAREAWAAAHRALRAELGGHEEPALGPADAPLEVNGFAGGGDPIRPPASADELPGGATAAAAAVAGAAADGKEGDENRRRDRVGSLDWTLGWSPEAFFSRKTAGDAVDRWGSVASLSAAAGGGGGGGGGTTTTSTTTRPWVAPGSDQESFVRLLDAEAERAVLFLLAETGRLAERLGALLSASSAAAAVVVDPSRPPPLPDEYRSAASRLAELYLFVAANLTAVRKILERHDDAVHAPWGAPLAEWYVRSRGGGDGGAAAGLEAGGRTTAGAPPPHLESLLSRGGLESVRGSLLRGAALEADRKLRAAGHGAISLREEAMSATRRADPALANVDAVAERLKTAEHGSVKDYVVLGSLGNTLAFEPAVVSESIGEHDLDLAFYASQREWLLRNIVVPIPPAAAREGLVGAEIELGGEVKGTSGLDYYLPLSLNLFSTFLYMVNYFIAGPTSAVYIETLGGNKALAGMVIGATPWAAMFSAVVFSVWTNYNFKRPLLFSGVCLCVGNLLYGCAYKFDSIALVMLGRVAVGLGGPRVINRRYIADICPLESRTAVSAAFVTLSAAGVAVGPGLSALVQTLDFTFDAFLLGEVEVNGLTAPGYLMFLVWLVFSVTLVATFHEPERTGLQQLQDKETLMFSGDAEENGAGGSAAVVPGQSADDCTRASDRAPGHPAIEGADDVEGGGGEYGQYVATSPERNKGAAAGPGAPASEGGETEALLGRHRSAQQSSGGANNYSSTVPAGADDGEKAEIGIVKDDGEETSAETDDPPSSFSETSKHMCCIQHFNVQVWICIILLFVDKFAQEAVMSAAPIITGHRYGWSVEMIGALGVAIGALVVPLSIGVGWLSRHFEDRVILRWLLFVALIGLMFLVDAKELVESSSVEAHNEGGSFLGVGPRRYICGSLIAFSGLQCMESVIMSALSKVVPHSLAVGVCNSGLINTETGTLGRAMGDVAVTLAGFVGLHGMLNTLMLPLVFVILGCIVMVQMNYRILAV